MIPHSLISKKLKKSIDDIGEFLKPTLITYTKKQWDKEFEHTKVVWTSEKLRKAFKSSNLRFFLWSSVTIDGKNYLLPGVHKNCHFLYKTKKPINNSIIVEL